MFQSWKVQSKGDEKFSFLPVQKLGIFQPSPVQNQDCNRSGFFQFGLNIEKSDNFYTKINTKESAVRPNK